MTSFTGIPVAALDFYDDLEQDNTKAFWDSHKDVYLHSVKQPMLAAADSLEDEFGEGKLFRPNRDVRFSRDKSPYKTHQGLYVATAEATGYYLQVSAAGVMVGVGFYDAKPDRLARIRAAIDGPHGPALEKVIARLRDQGWTVGGDTVATAPRGYAKDHPRIELLRHKTLSVSKQYGFDPFVHTPELLDHVSRDWRAGTPLLQWLSRTS